MAVLLFSVSASQSSIMLTHTLPPPALKPHDNQRNYHISTSPSAVFPLSLCLSVSLVFLAPLVFALSIHISLSLKMCFVQGNQVLFHLDSKTVFPHSSTGCNIDFEK